MDKLLEFGRKAMFYVRVLSGYEERRIRSYRIQLQQRLQQAQARKAAISKVPEQIIISEVRKMVEDMQALNKKLEETEAAIEDYFKPIDKEAEMIMQAQLSGEEKTMREMAATMQRQALLERAEAEKLANSQNAKADQHVLANSQNAEADQHVLASSQNAEADQHVLASSQNAEADQHVQANSQNAEADQHVQTNSQNAEADQQVPELECSDKKTVRMG